MMADPKDTDAPGGNPARRPQAASGSGDAAPGGTPGGPARGGSPPPPAGNPPADAPAAATVRTRETQYLIAPRTYAGGLRPLSADALESHLNTLEGVTVVRKITKSGVGALSSTTRPRHATSWSRAPRPSAGRNWSP